MCRLRNIAMSDYQESVTTGQTEGQTDRQTPDKVIPMCRYASQATKNVDFQCHYQIPRWTFQTRSIKKYTRNTYVVAYGSFDREV